MYLDRKLEKVLSVITLVLVIIAVGLLLFRKPETMQDDPIKIPTPNQIKYGMSFESTVSYNFDIIRRSIAAQEEYAEYTLRDEYTMIYQITNEENELKIKDYLGIRTDLPEIDYSKRYLLLSVGREIYDISSRSSGVDKDGQPVLDVVYAEMPYESGKVFVYSMNMQKMSSGDSLEFYYWENAHKMSNLIFDDSYEKEVISEGKFHTLYVRSDKKYVYRLYDHMGENVKKRAISQIPVVITEHADTILRIETEEKTVYYNPQKNIYSEEYTVPTGYLIYNIITYMRLHEDEIQLILRDAYDKFFYAKIVRLPFTNDRENIYDLVKSVEVIDDTSVWVEYYKGENRELVREVVEVYNLKR